MSNDITRIHTIQINHAGHCSTEGIECMQDMGRRGTVGAEIQLIKINPNKYAGRYINSLGEFCDVMRRIQGEYGLRRYAISRIDIACDNAEDVYEQRLKQDLITIALLSIDKKLHNRFYSFDFMTLENLTIRAQSSAYVVENYNKYLESGGKDEVKKRMEFRTLRVKCKTYEDIQKKIDDWITELNTSAEHYDELQQKMNRALLEKFQIEREFKEIRERAFITSHRNFFFSTRQVVKFYEAIDKTEGAAHHFTSKSDIKWFRQKEIKEYIDRYIESIKIFRK